MRLTDTRTRRSEPIEPATPGVLRVYACGPTVYRYAHVGNLRTFLLTDLIRRVADVVHGWQIQLVQNITDVGHLVDDTFAEDSAGDGAGDGADDGAGDGLRTGGSPAAEEDKVLAQARREGKSAFDLARFYEAAFHRDLSALGVLPADEYPRASDSIAIMLDLIGRLIDQGHAYIGRDRTVYFDARSFPSYGALSGNRLDELRPGHRMHPDEAGAKRFHADWALWKAAGANREMVWDSPWGVGFPGWHIECSAMSLTHLGETIDIHTGGIDLRFPHHEDERAQSDSAVGHEVVRHWVHGEHLLADGRKMAKSTGNVVLVSDVEARGLDPLALRLFFLTGRYRQQMNLTWEALTAADKRLKRWRARLAQWAESPSKPMCTDYVRRLHDAVDDDLDTPTALVALGELERDDSIPPGAKFETFAYADRLLGLDLARDVGRARPVEPLPAGAQELLDARAQAREARDYATSDRLREQLAGLGVAVTDTRDGQSWSVDASG